MNGTAPDLNALLVSRICHDLISPLGAISNGIELLHMSGVGESPEMALISESVENANTRIRFFRVAFGAALPGQGIGQSEIASILGALSAGRLKFDWQVPGPAQRTEVKLCFLLIQCLESALPWGGRITVTHTGTAWRIEGQAERIRPLPDLWPIVTGQGTGAGIDASQVHFPLAERAAAEIGRTIALSQGDGVLGLSF